MDSVLMKRLSCPPVTVAKRPPISLYQQKGDGGSSYCATGSGRGSLGTIGARKMSYMSFCRWDNADDHQKRRIEIQSSYWNPFDERGSSGLEILASSSSSSTSCSSSSVVGSSSVVNYSRGRQIPRKKRRDLVRSVVSMVGIPKTHTSSSNSSSRESRSEAPSEDDLKDQLEALQDEALHVRDRYNNARARFMRLTEVAQQLRRRAKLDIDAGDEGSARNLLDEKRKVIRAAELSKKRAELLEELSVKLDEAISKKETQLIFALSSMQSSSDSEPTTVRVVSPKDDERFLSDDDEDVSKRNKTKVSDQEAAEDVMASDEVLFTRAESLLGETQENGGQDVSRQKQEVPTVKSGEDAIPQEDKGNESGADFVYSTFRDLYGKEAELEATLSELFSDSESLPSEIAGETAGTTGDSVLQSPAGKLLASDESQAALTSRLQVDDAVGPKDDGLSSSSETIDSRSHKSDAADVVNGSKDEKNTGPDSFSYGAVDSLLGRTESMGAVGGAAREVSFYDGESLLFADYVRDVDHQVAAAESKLRMFMVTTVSSNQETVDEKLRLVGELLEQVQSLRARLSEVVKQFRDTRVNGVPELNSSEKD